MRTVDRVPYAVARMKAVLLTLLHLTVTAARLRKPGGVRVVVAENLPLKQQLMVRLAVMMYGPSVGAGANLSSV